LEAVIEVINNPGFVGCVLIAVGYLSVRVIRRDAAAIHTLVNSRLDATLDSVERLQAEVEKLGGEAAPPTRKESREAADRNE
jgi:hypothetical protein